MDYTAVMHDADSENSGTKKSWKPFLRQACGHAILTPGYILVLLQCLYHKSEEKPIQQKYLAQKWFHIFICTGVWSCYFNSGLYISSPTVFIPQIRKEANSTEVISKEMASWLSSCVSYGAVPSAMLLSYLPHFIGRKRSHIFVVTLSVVSFIMLYSSSSPIYLLLSEIIQGPASAYQMTIGLLIVTEFVSPCYRGMFLTLKSATFLWGIWVSNTIGTFTHWSNIPILGGTIATYSLITAMFWPESPYWLASQDRFEECAISHRWLRGNSEKAEEELKSLIDLQFNKKERLSIKGRLMNIQKVLRKRTFYKRMMMMFLLILLYVFCGKLSYAVYAIDIIRKITGSEHLAYRWMLILDGVTVIGVYIGCGLSKIIRRRFLIIATTSTGLIFLLCLSMYIYLIKIDMLAENNYITIALLTGYSLAISCGPIIMSTTIIGELIPLQSRSSYTAMSGMLSNFAMGTMLKLTPLLFSILNTHGAFLFHVISTSFILILIYKYLPETKDKTLVEISNNLKKNKLSKNNELSKLKTNP